MSFTPLVYTSTDPGAPQLTGQVGSLVALLDAVLVNGYGSGATAKPGAGWTLAFTGLNKRAYRNNPLFSGGYLRVDDSNSVAGATARVAYVRAYESMSGIDVGMNPSPTPAQLANGDTWAKSYDLNGVARAWTVIATAKWFYIFMDVNNLGLVGAVPQFAGDIDSIVPGDKFAFVVSSGSGGNAAPTVATSVTGILYGQNNFSSLVSSGSWMLRGINGTPGGVALLPCVDRGKGSGNDPFGRNGFPYPAPGSGGLLADPIYLRESAWTLRGMMPNCFGPLHALPLTDMATYQGLSGFGGSEVLAKSYRGLSVSVSYAGQVLFDLTRPVL